jgi:hypothetical protein
MKIVDLNVLLYVVDRNSPHHDVALQWWTMALASNERIGLTWTVAIGFLRVATSPRVFPHPLSAEQALEVLDAWWRHPNVVVARESEDHWSILRALLADAGTAGNLSSDAHLAAIAIGYGASLVSFDADFGRFQKLRWEKP